jgi:homoserine O-acetyltransferase
VLILVQLGSEKMLDVTSHSIVVERDFLCERGGVLPEVEARFTTYGALSEKADNVVWILHPLTCSANPLDWWAGFVGPGKLIDPSVHYIVCVNSLGSCYGTTGPGSIDGKTGGKFGLDFPSITIRDVVAVHEAVRRHLGIEMIKLGIGGSFGGQQLLEWLVACPDIFNYACVIGAGARQSPWARAFNESQRMALEADPTFYAKDRDAGQRGLAAARSVAMLSYRNHEVYETRQQEEDDAIVDNFKACSYQRYIGDKFTRRFDSHAYWFLTKAMDSHNIARGRGSMSSALARIKAKTLLIALEGDMLFPREDISQMMGHIAACKFVDIDSQYGHDGLMVHADRVSKHLKEFISDSWHTHLVC